MKDERCKTKSQDGTLRSAAINEGITAVNNEILNVEQENLLDDNFAENKEDLIQQKCSENYSDNNDNSNFEIEAEKKFNDPEEEAESNALNYENTLELNEEKFEFEKENDIENTLQLSAEAFSNNPNDKNNNKNKTANIDNQIIENNLEMDNENDIENEVANENINNENKDSNLLKASHHKKSIRIHEKNKLLLKNNDLQHELDLYNSNFDVTNKKSHKNAKASNKIEFLENTEDLDKNINLEFDQQEERLISLFNKQKELDLKVSFLYVNKSSKYFQNKNDYYEYLDLVDYVAYCKDEMKRKKLSQNTQAAGANADKKDNASSKPLHKASISEESKDNDSEEYDQNENKKNVKAKKGRPKLYNKTPITNNDLNVQKNFTNNNDFSIDLKNVLASESIKRTAKQQTLLGILSFGIKIYFIYFYFYFLHLKFCFYYQKLFF